MCSMVVWRLQVCLQTRRNRWECQTDPCELADIVSCLSMTKAAVARALNASATFISELTFSKRFLWILILGFPSLSFEVLDAWNTSTFLMLLPSSWGLSSLSIRTCVCNTQLSFASDLTISSSLHLTPPATVRLPPSCWSFVCSN